MTSREGRVSEPGRPSTPVPGRQALLLAALIMGLVMLGMQLWLLTIALDLYLGGRGDEVWTLAIFSGLVFAGGLFTVALLSREPHLAGSLPDSSNR